MPLKAPVHRPHHQPERKAWAHPGRESRHARGYGRQWQLTRAQVLREEPLCRRCWTQGRTRAATNVDHIKPKAEGGTDDRSNLQPLCDDCERIKSAEDRRRQRGGS
jgi:5-methylcytosine-specific restriction enzyme A